MIVMRIIFYDRMIFVQKCISCQFYHKNKKKKNKNVASLGSKPRWKNFFFYSLFIVEHKIRRNITLSYQFICTMQHTLKRPISYHNRQCSGKWRRSTFQFSTMWHLTPKQMHLHSSDSHLYVKNEKKKKIKILKRFFAEN